MCAIWCLIIPFLIQSPNTHLFLSSSLPFSPSQFGIYEFVRKELMSRKEQDKPRDWLPPVIRRTLRLGDGSGSLQPQYFRDFVQNVYLLEEELL